VATFGRLHPFEAGFEAGTRAIIDVLDAQCDLLATRREHARSRYDYLLDTLELKQAAGVLAATDLAQINEWLVEISKYVTPSATKPVAPPVVQPVATPTRTEEPVIERTGPLDSGFS
jgi:hypothetical protein